MTTLTISAPRQYADRGWPAVSATVEADGRRFDIFYRVSQGPIFSGPEPFLLAALLPAMKLGADIHVSGAVSSYLLRHAAMIQQYIVHWWDGYKAVTIQAQPRVTTSINPDRRTGCFFSGGVDSSYTILTRKHEIDDLIFVHGLDIGMDNTPLRVKVARTIHRAADDIGKPLIEVETNVRDLLDPYTDWAAESDGAAMAGIGHVLSEQMQLVYMSSGAKISKRMSIGGSNPLLLQLFGDPEIEIGKAGGEANRYEKIVQLAKDGAAMRWLRVCWENSAGEYNCGQCAKCLHTMVTLSMAGALEQCQTFDRPLDLDLVRTVPLGRSDRNAFAEALATGERIGADAAILQALRDRLQKVEALKEDDQRLTNEMLVAQRRISHLETKLKRVRSSHSWRLTSPLRRLGRLARTIRERLA